MDVFLDTSFVISLIIRTDRTEKARKFFTETGPNLVTSVAASLHWLENHSGKEVKYQNAYKLRSFIRRERLLGVSKPTTQPNLCKTFFSLNSSRMRIAMRSTLA